MARYRKSIRWKNVLSGVLCLLLVVGAVMGLTTFTAKDTTAIRSTAVSVGGINDEGTYVKTETSIYTKDMFECQGLTIEPDFEATGTYQVFYYDSDKNFLGTTEVLNAEDGVYTKGDSFAFAQYARIVITPAVSVDEDADENAVFRIRFYEVLGYANDYNVCVSKKQEHWFVTDFDHSSRTTGKTYSVDENTNKVREDPSENTVTVFSRFDVSEYKELAMLLEVTGGAGNGHILFTDEDGVYVDKYDFTLGDGKTVDNGSLLFESITIPKNAVYAYMISCTAASLTMVYGR